jgi:HNH endonuclease/EVE domain
MRTWVFQGNPDDFDIDGYLATRPAEFPWLVTRYADEIGVGDRVYIWRTQGKQGAVAGVIAEAEVIALATLRPESPDAVRFWRAGASEGTALLTRAMLRLVRIAGPREVIQRNWCMEDPILRDLPNLKMAAATNYPLSQDHAERLATLWSRTGHDWTRDESVAGLWAYARTFGGPVSILPDSPVAIVALRIGRAVGGVYNKVMNFRHLDPRDERRGMSGAGDADEGAWAEFYDVPQGELRLAELDAEFDRLWGHEGSIRGADPRSEDEALDVQARAFEREDLPSLLARYGREAVSRPKRPRATPAATKVFERSALVIAIARTRANHMCEVPACHHSLFVCLDGRTYLEVHHIVPLGEGGEDTPANVACVCPAHHREAHVGSKAGEIATALAARRAREAEPTSAWAGSRSPSNA